MDTPALRATSLSEWRPAVEVEPGSALTLGRVDETTEDRKPFLQAG
jgi:hypothetical protein